MRARLIVISSKSGEHTAQLALAKNNDMIQAFAAQRPDQALGDAILPRRSGRYRTITDAHRPHPRGKDMSVGAVIVTDQASRRRCPGERLGDLESQPFRRRMPGHLNPQQLPSTVANDQEGKQPLKCHRRNDAQVDRSNRMGVIVQKRLPALGRRSSAARHVFRNRRLGDLKTQHQQFAVDPGRAPQRVLPAHPPDQVPQAPVNPGPPHPLSRPPAPIGSETCSLPSQHGLWLDYLDHLQQARPKPDHPNHEGAIATVQSNSWWRVRQCKVQLMPKK